MNDNDLNSKLQAHKAKVIIYNQEYYKKNIQAKRKASRVAKKNATEVLLHDRIVNTTEIEKFKVGNEELRLYIDIQKLISEVNLELANGSSLQQLGQGSGVNPKVIYNFLYRRNPQEYLLDIATNQFVKDNSEDSSSSDDLSSNTLPSIDAIIDAIDLARSIDPDISAFAASSTPINIKTRTVLLDTNHFNAFAQWCKIHRYKQHAALRKAIDMLMTKLMMPISTEQDSILQRWAKANKSNKFVALDTAIKLLSKNQEPHSD